MKKIYFTLVLFVISILTFFLIDNLTVNEKDLQEIQNEHDTSFEETQVIPWGGIELIGKGGTLKKRKVK
ncbi:hypothetical protein [Gracilibacillus boraciitolerans]|nr:hypothetical protein [Gracilibacillus boraciitolerans]